MKNILFLIIILFSIDKVFPQVDLNIQANAKKQSELYTEAIDGFSKLISTEKNEVNYFILRGECYYKLNKLSEAQNDFEKAERLKPGIASLYLSKIYSLKNDEENAIKYLEAHLKSSYKKPKNEIIQEKEYKNIENSNKWQEIWKKEWYSKSEILITEINYLLNNKEYFEALNLLDNEISKKRKKHQLWNYRGEIYAALNNHKSAVKNYSFALNHYKRNYNYYSNRANSYYILGKYKNALEDINKAIKLNKTDFTLYIKKALTLNKLEKYDEAIKECLFYLSLFPDDQEIIFLCGKTYSNKNDYYKAIEFYNKNLSNNGSNPEYYLARGTAYLKLEKIQSAINDYSMSLDIDPNNVEAYLQRGIARLRAGDKKGACIDWNKASAKGSNEAKRNILNYCD